MTDREITQSLSAVVTALERLSLRGYADWATGVGCINEINAVKKEIEGRVAHGELSKQVHRAGD